MWWWHPIGDHSEVRNSTHSSREAPKISSCILCIWRNSDSLHHWRMLSQCKYIRVYCVRWMSQQATLQSFSFFYQHPGTNNTLFYYTIISMSWCRARNTTRQNRMVVVTDFRSSRLKWMERTNEQYWRVDVCATDKDNINSCSPIAANRVKCAKWVLNQRPRIKYQRKKRLKFTITVRTFDNSFWNEWLFFMWYELHQTSNIFGKHLIDHIQ